MEHNKDPDIIISRILKIVLAIIILYILYLVSVSIHSWYLNLQSQNLNVWSELWIIIKNNISVVSVVYCIICLQVSGVAEFKFKKPFIKALLLSFILTPPIMMIAWGRKNVIRDGGLK